MKFDRCGLKFDRASEGDASTGCVNQSPMKHASFFVKPAQLI